MTIKITEDLIVITCNGIKWGYVGYTITEALKLFVMDGNEITNKRLINWSNTKI